MTTTPRRHSPFAPVMPALLVATAYALAAIVWTVAGHRLSGGRWLAVHLFTLGVLTNVVIAFTNHFAATLTRVPNSPPRPWRVIVLNLGVLGVLVGLPTGSRLLLGAGATTVTCMVMASWWHLRAMRRAALGARFTWVVRVYEWAHGAFVLGAVLGALMGTGVFAGSWYVASKIAHLHVNLLGWGGLTLLATLVFFGPTVARTKILPGADDRAARDLRLAASALIVAAMALAAMGVGGVSTTGFRLVAATALGGYAYAASRVCRDVARAARVAKPSYGRAAVIAVCSWFPVVVWSDVALVATGAWRHLDALGLAMILGVLTQSVLMAVAHVAPMLRGSTRPGRDAVLTRIDMLTRPRVGAHNIGVLMVVAASLVGGTTGAAMARGGWAALIIATASLAVAIAAPLPTPAEPAATSP